MTFFTNFDNHYNGKTFADVLTSIKSKEADVKAKLKSAVEDTSGNRNGNDDEVNLLYEEIDKQLTAKGTNPFSAANVESIGTDIDFLKLNFTKAKKNLGKRTAAAPDAKLSSPDVQVEKALYLLNSNDKDEFAPFDGAPAAAPAPAPAPTPPPAANTKPTVSITPITTPLTGTDDASRTVVISNANLQATDPETTNPAELTYTLGDITGGKILNNSTEIAKGATFTQKDIDDGKIQFVWEGTTPSGVGFKFTVKDAGTPPEESAEQNFEVPVTIPSLTSTPPATITKPITPTSEIQINGQETIQVQPNTANDTEIGTLTVPGADVKSYELKDTSGKFKIEGDKLKVKNGSLIVPLDTITLTIKATDKEATANTIEKTITVSIPAASVPPTPANPATSVAPTPAETPEVKANKNLQNLLKDRGFYNGTIDGVMSQTTRDAVIAAQKAYGLTADGIAGAQTIAALERGAPAGRTTTRISVEETTRIPTSKVVPPLAVRDNIPDTNRAVLIQSVLRKTGDYNGLVTGEWDSASNEAYTKWETENPGQDINTILPRGTRSVSGKLLGSWSSGADVKTVQTFLNRQKTELGIETLEVDGEYGPLTEAAVRAFQTKYNQDNPNSKIKEDGILGPETELAINSKYAPTNLFDVS